MRVLPAAHASNEVLYRMQHAGTMIDAPSFMHTHLAARITHTHTQHPLHTHTLACS